MMFEFNQTKYTIYIHPKFMYRICSTNYKGGGAGRSSGLWSADPEGPGIWVIFLVKRKKEGIFGNSLENEPSYAKFNGIPNILVPNNPQFVC